MLAAGCSSAPGETGGSPSNGPTSNELSSNETSPNDPSSNGLSSNGSSVTDGPLSPDGSPSTGDNPAHGASPGRPEPDFDDIIDTGVDDNDIPRPDYAAEPVFDAQDIPGNLLLNPGFEDGLQGWAKEIWNAQIEMAPDTERVRSGEKSALFTVVDYVSDTYPGISQSFSVSPGDIAGGGVWVRTYGCEDGVGPYAVLDFLDAKSNRINWVSSVWARNMAVREWTLLTVDGVVPEGCVRVVSGYAFPEKAKPRLTTRFSQYERFRRREPKRP